RIEDGLTHVFSVVATDGIRKDRQKIFDSESRRLHQLGIVESRMQITWMDVSPSVAEAICIVTFDVKALLEIVLKNRNGIVPSLDQQIDGFRSEQRRVEAVEKDRSAAALRVSDFAGEDRFPRRIASPVPL